MIRPEDLGDLTLRFNPPKRQDGPILWAAFCLFGLGLAGYVVLHYPLGSDGWVGGLLLAAMSMFAFLSIEGWWLWSQREVQVASGRVTVRTWLDALRGRSGRSIPLSAVSSVSLVLGAGKRLEIAAGEHTIRFWVGLWPRDQLILLCRAVEQMGIRGHHEWQP